MSLKLKLLTSNIASTILLFFFLCLGSQNLNNRFSLNFLIYKTVPLPIGFLVGTSFSLGILSGGLNSILMLDNKINKKN